MSTQHADDPNADTLELPRQLVEELAREANLLGCALTGLNQMDARSFVELETARLLAREYESRLNSTLAELEAELGLASDAYVSGILTTFKAHEAAKRRELAEELAAGD